MPKKFTGENSKAVAARARKAEVKNEEQAKIEKEKEDAKWVDDDKHAMKKMQRKEDQERKKQEALEKKQEKAKLLEEEMNALTKSSNTVLTKVTKAQIEAKKQKDQELMRQEEEERRLRDMNIVKEEEVLQENVNKLIIEDGVARNVEEAIAVLEDETSPLDRHPEKRLKAAYAAFEERRLVELKVEKPTLRLSQLKQLLKKEWTKSPENPLNVFK